MIKKEHKLSVLLLFLGLSILTIDTYVFSKTVRQNLELVEILESSLVFNEVMSMQLRSCSDMVKVYKEVDLYAHPN